MYSCASAHANHIKFCIGVRLERRQGMGACPMCTKRYCSVFAAKKHIAGTRCGLLLERRRAAACSMEPLEQHSVQL